MEQEVALVKSIPAEYTIENDPDYQEYKSTLQLYAGVLTGEEEAFMWWRIATVRMNWCILV